MSKLIRYVFLLGMVLAIPAAEASIKQIKVKDSAFSDACANDVGRPGACKNRGSGGTGDGAYNQYEVCTQTAGRWTCHTVRCPTGDRGNCIVISNSSPAKAVTVVKSYLNGGKNPQAGSTMPKSPGGNSSSGSSAGNGGNNNSGSSATVAGGGHAIGGGGCAGGVC